MYSFVLVSVVVQRRPFFYNPKLVYCKLQKRICIDGCNNSRSTSAREGGEKGWCRHIMCMMSWQQLKLGRSEIQGRTVFTIQITDKNH
jgi:hypothetical protein